MKLTDGYHVSFLHWDSAEPNHYKHVSTLADANGVCFECPKCRNHIVICWFIGVPQHETLTGPGRWAASGRDLSDLSLVPSVWPSCGWHGFVTNGEAN